MSASAAHSPVVEMPRALSEREEQVAILVADALSNKEIAVRLGISEQRVKNVLVAVFLKLQIECRVQLARYVWTGTSGHFRAHRVS